jgi:hypothetical protein
MSTKALKSSALSFFADRPKQSPSDWCCENLRFDEPDNHGPFRMAGNEYNREPLDSFADQSITDRVMVYGSQAKKTGTIMGGGAYLSANDPCRIFWVMPSIGLAQKFSRTRLMPMLRASKGTKDLIPTGARRHDFKTLELQLGAAIIDFTGSNSAGNLASTPARAIFQDEVDKFDTGGTEADASNLADQRCKNVPNPIKVKTSTPTIVEGLIWQEFLKTDMRRRFMPCPHCKKHVIFIWSKQYTILPLTGFEACVKWDQSAKRADGSWDLDRVEKSAHAECPHCGGHILDAHKTWMDRNGEWRPTKEAARSYRGWHLSSLYAITPETTFGKLAVKFLQAKNSLLGLQGFINGDLAEPYQAQDTLGKRVETISSGLDVTAEWKKLLTVDCQFNAPHFWFVVRAWNGGNSEGIQAGSCDTYEEIERIQKQHNIPDVGVAIDSGFGAKSDAEVYRTCAAHSQIVARRDKKPLCIGWMPVKGMPGYKRWNDQSTKLILPYTVRDIDPFIGLDKAGIVAMSLFEFSGSFFLDILDNLRKGKGGFKWSVTQAMNTAEYWRHLDGEYKGQKLNKLTGKVTSDWIGRSSGWPNHLLDCEKIQVASASFLTFFKLDFSKTE